MKIKLILAGTLLCVPLFSQSEPEVIDTQAYCDTTEKIVKDLTAKYGETPILIGSSGDVAKSTMTLWTNPKTKSWSIIATSKETSCIIGVGDKLKTVNLNEIRTQHVLPPTKKGSKISVL
jgi:hypothetical protein